MLYFLTMMHRKNINFHSFFIKFLIGTLFLLASATFYKDFNYQAKNNLIHKAHDHKKVIQDMKPTLKVGKKSDTKFHHLISLSAGVLFLSALMSLIVPIVHVIYKRFKAEMDSVRDPPPCLLL